MASADNPLLLEFTFPPYDAIEAKHIRPAIRSLLNKLEAELIELENTAEPTWPKLVIPLEKIIDRLSVAWGIVNHLNSVKDTPELRAAIEEIQPAKVEFQLKLRQSKVIYRAFKAIRESPDWENLNDARKRVVLMNLKEAVLNGVSLEDSSRERFNEIEQELEKLGQKFEENILDATKNFEKLITDKKEIQGLPFTILTIASETAIRKGYEEATADKGPWIITLDGPMYRSILQHCSNRSLREEVFRAYVTRASYGPLNNTPLIERILQLRLEKTKLLGYCNYAEVSMETKMATIDKANDLIEKLHNASWSPAVKDMEDIRDFAIGRGAEEAKDMDQWDINFWSERLRESNYDINEEELRPYFSLPKVMDGLFNLAKRLFDIYIEPAEGIAPVWNKDVSFYKIKDSSNTTIAYFYFDPYSRPSEKRGGAWMDVVVGRTVVFSSDNKSPRLPICHVVCNQTPPVKDKPSLMTIREVETVFHEFGHALQHMLTRQNEGLVSGTKGIEWDAVEIASQFMENWCYQRFPYRVYTQSKFMKAVYVNYLKNEINRQLQFPPKLKSYNGSMTVVNNLACFFRDTMLSIARHYETGESLAEETCLRVLSARTFRAGSLLLRQLRYASLDLELHSKYVPGAAESVHDLDQRIGKKTHVIPLLPEDRFLCSFSHIFADKYAAGYYSYQWAEVLSYDAFSAFEEGGLDNEHAIKAMGSKFRETILAIGGGKSPNEVFLEFRGREPSPDPFLHYNGLLPVVVP